MENKIQIIYDMIDYGEPVDKILEKVKELYGMDRNNIHKVRDLITKRTLERTGGISC